MKRKRRRFSSVQAVMMAVGFVAAAILLQKIEVADPTLRSVIYFGGAAGGWGAYELFARWAKRTR